MIQTPFAIMRLFFYKVSITFNILLPTLRKILYTRVVKFSTSTSGHIMKTLFQFVIICKMASAYSQRVPDTNCEQVGEEQSIPFLQVPHVCKLMWSQAMLWRRASFMFWLGWTLWMHCHRLFKVTLYHSWWALKSKQGILQHWFTESYSMLAKVC
jgi:hypothetical protein